jgi:hypothetical protein
LTTAGGAPVVLNCGHARDYALFELQLMLEKGVVAMEDGGMAWRIREAGPSPHFTDYRSLSPGELIPGRYLDSMAAAAANIHDCLTRGAPLASTGDTALSAQRLCEQVRARAQDTHRNTP